MYESGMESLKKAALSVKVRSFLSGQVGVGGVGGGDLDHLVDNPELSLDLQSLIDDPNFSEVSDGLFPDLLQQHDKQGVSVNGKVLDPNYNSVNNSMRSSLGHYNNQRNPLAYMPQPVHGGSSFTPGSNASSPGSSPVQGDHHHQQQNPHHHNSNGHHHHNNGHHIISVSGSGGGVKSEPSETNPNGGRLDFNANTVSSSSDPGYSSYSSNNLTSPSSSSSSSSSSSTTSSTGGGGGGQSSANNNNNNNYPGSYGLDGHNALAQHLNSHSHLHGAMMKNGGGGGGGGSHTFNPLKGLGSHHHSHHGSSGGLSKKLKNVDKASDEYKRRRERNNIAVRKSREKAKMRSRETEERVKILAKENERLQKKIDLLTEELTFLRSFFSNVGGLPEQIHREFNKHLETFQHHHIQNGIQ
jgi:hypothetical protein